MATSPRNQPKLFNRPAATVRMSCRDTMSRLWEFADGELDAGLLTSMRAHLHGCRRCRDQYEGFVAFLEKVAQAGASDPATESLRERVDALLRERGLLS